MFKITSDPKFTHPVTVCRPVDGGHVEETFKVTYRVVDVDQLGGTHDLEGQQIILKKIVCGFEEVVGEDDKPLPYSEELRDQLIAKPFIRAAMFQTYLAAVTKTKVGN